MLGESYFQPSERYVGSVNMHETMPACCGYRRRPIPGERHIPSARRGPCARRGIYPIRSARSNPSCRFFSRKKKWRSTGDPRSPDREQPSRKCPRTLARPATGTSVSRGFPHMGTPVPRTRTRPHRGEVLWASMKPGPHSEVRPAPDDPRTAPCWHSEPRGRTGGGSGSRECMGANPGATDVAAAGGRGSAVDGRGIVGILYATGSCPRHASRNAHVCGGCPTNNLRISVHEWHHVAEVRSSYMAMPTSAMQIFQ